MKDSYDQLLQMWREEKEKRKKAEEEIEKLKAELARAKEDHQYDNLVHQKELEEIKKWNPRLDGSGR